MKITLFIQTFLIFIILTSCGHKKNKKSNSIVAPDTLLTSFEKKEQERLKKRKKIKELHHKDSLRLDKILKEAMKMAYQNINKNNFDIKYNVWPDSIPVSVEINLNHHFTKSNSHLIIRRKEPGTIYIDIFSKDRGKYIKVISHEQWSLTYTNDTIRDINGDGLNDFVVNWYGASGCCLKAYSDIYLQRQNKKTFSKKIVFINPTFSPNEKIVRGICYGHPGETEMYKYKWVGEQIDTLEYVSYEKDDKGKKTGKILISSDKPFFGIQKPLKVLKSIPSEYKKIEGYDWFTGYKYK